MHFKTASEAMAALKEGTVAAVMAPRSDLEAGLGKDRQGFEISALLALGLAG
jgi:ABC-type amino acid transport substrate-binding protein